VVLARLHVRQVQQVVLHLRVRQAGQHVRLPTVGRGQERELRPGRYFPASPSSPGHPRPCRPFTSATRNASGHWFTHSTSTLAPRALRASTSHARCASTSSPSSASSHLAFSSWFTCRPSTDWSPIWMVG